MVKHIIATRSYARLLIFDPMDEYRDAERASTLAALGRATRGARFALRYVPPRADAAATIARASQAAGENRDASGA